MSNDLTTTQRLLVAEALVNDLTARFGAVREIRGCLGAGPMDYEMFVDELDDILAGTSPRIQPAT